MEFSSTPSVMRALCSSSGSDCVNNSDLDITSAVKGAWRCYEQHVTSGALCLHWAAGRDLLACSSKEEEEIHYVHTASKGL